MKIFGEIFMKFTGYVRERHYELKKIFEKNSG